MPTPELNLTELAKWALVVVIGPLLVWLAKVFAARRQVKRRKDALVRDLTGLPMECKAILVDFHNKGSDTLRTDPGSPPMRVLVEKGIMSRGPGGGTYDAVDSYMSVRPDIWKVMNDWAAADPDLIAAGKRGDGVIR